MFALVAVCGGGAVWTTTTLANALQEAERDGEMLRSHLTADMMHDALRADVLAGLAARSPEAGLSINDVKADLKEHVANVRAMITGEQTLDASDKVRAALAAVEAPLNHYITAAERLIGLAETDPANAMAGLPDFMRQFGELEEAMEGVTEVIAADATANAAAARANADFAKTLVLVVLAAGLLMTALLAVGADRLLVRPVKQLTDAMTGIAAGNDSIEAPFQMRVDEIGAMGKALAGFKQAAIDHKLEQKAQQERNEALVNESFGDGLSRLAEGDLTCRIERDLPPAYVQLQRDFNAAMERLQKAMRSIS